MEFDAALEDLPKHFAVNGDIVTSHVLAVLPSFGTYVRALTSLRERFQSENANLAYTAALEHDTATLAETTIWTMVSLAMDETARREPGRVLRGAWRLRRTPFASPGSCASSSGTTGAASTPPTSSRRGGRSCSGPTAACGSCPPADRRAVIGDGR